jgi:hypothetical protein
VSAPMIRRKYRDLEAEVETLVERKTRAEQMAATLPKQPPLATRRPAEPMETVYLFAAFVPHPIVKIGITNSVERRAREIFTHSPVACTLVASVNAGSERRAREIEQHLHRQHKAARSHGEWFLITPDEAERSLMAALAR